MAGFTKLFSDIIHSTIWREDNETRIVWVTMLAMADSRGEVHASVPGLADAARVDLDECIVALKKLSLPDKWSRSKDYEGRRIEEIQGGWLLLNHARYKRKLSNDDQREQARMRQRRKRERDRLSREKSRSVTQCHAMSHESRHTDTDTEEDTYKGSSDLNQADLLQPNGEKKQSIKSGAKAPRARVIKYSDGFEHWWAHYPKKIGKAAAFKVWTSMLPNMPALGEMVEKLLLQSKTYQWKRDNRQYVPHPRTYLNQGRWDDEITENDMRPPETASERRKREDDESYAQRLEEARQRDWERQQGGTGGYDERRNNNAGNPVFV